MVTDEKLYFDKDAALTGSRMSANVINLGVIRDIAKGSPVYLNLLVTTAFTSATYVTTVSIAVSSNTPNSGDAVPVGYGFAHSKLTKGYLFRTALPEEILTQKKISLSYANTTAAAAGKISAFLTIG